MPAFAPLLKLDEVTTAGDDVAGVVVIDAGEPVVEVLAPDAEVWELMEELVEELVEELLEELVVLDDAVMLK
jgi:restriction endonuclease Mrr